MTAPSTQVTTLLTQFNLTTASEELVPRLTQAGHHDALVQGRHDEVLPAIRQVRDRETGGRSAWKRNFMDDLARPLVVRAENRTPALSLARKQQGGRREQCGARVAEEVVPRPIAAVVVVVGGSFGGHVEEAELGVGRHGGPMPDVPRVLQEASRAPGAAAPDRGCRWARPRGCRPLSARCRRRTLPPSGPC